MFVGGLPPPSLELESQRPPNFSVPSTYARAVRQTAARVCRVIKLDERKTFMASTRPHTPKKIATRMLTCNLFAVMYLLRQLS